MMGVSRGAAMNGMRPFCMHNRPDFILLAIESARSRMPPSSTSWTTARRTVPMVVWAAIGRGWGSGAQHSQAIQGCCSVRRASRS